ncbi:MAG TPA: toll/interleukin-1 receptor domain-containing protein [Gemmatimonadaceae bacterium]|nr:toll/interleukin-1 receptor domain-containing protein [Gemmatimonadaceae bacterium]
MQTSARGSPVVFISYRREDSGGHVGRLYDALSARFGAERLFFDIDHIGAGEDFVRVIDGAVGRSSVMLVVIGKRWAGVGKAGARRVDQENDYVRLEVGAGLRREGLRVIPVLIQGARMPAPASLPEDLRDLTRRNAIELSDTRWREDVARLEGSIADVIPNVPTPAAPAVSRAAPRAIPRWAPWAGGAAVLLLVGGGIVLTRSHTAAVPAVTPAQSTGSVAPAAIPSGDTPEIPSQLPAAARKALGDARKWRADAELTRIQVQLTNRGGGTTSYQVSYGFRSPKDGAGLTMATSPSGSPRYDKMAPVSTAGLRAVPDAFVDLPDAISVARQAGLFGDVRDARLTPMGSGDHASSIWAIRAASGDDRVYYVDGATGKITTPPPSTQKKGAGFVDKVKGLFR